jgi:hypothetical protein
VNFLRHQRHALLKLLFFCSIPAFGTSITSHDLSGKDCTPVFRRIDVIMLTYMSQQIYFYVSVDDLKESGNSWIMIRHCNHQTTFNNGYQRKNTYQKLHIARTGLRKSFLVKVSVFWNLMTHILLYLYHSFGGVCSRYLQDVQREEEKIELFLNFPEHHSSKFLRNVVTCVTLYKDSYSIGLE